jgi:hypothetical protein
MIGSFWGSGVASTSEFVQNSVRKVLDQAGFSAGDIRFDIHDEAPCTVTADVTVSRGVSVSSTVRSGKHNAHQGHSRHESAKSAAASDANTALEKIVREGTLELDMASRPRAYADPSASVVKQISDHSVVDDCPDCRSNGKVTCHSCNGSKATVCTTCRGGKKKKCTSCEGTGEDKCYQCSGTKKASCTGCNGQGWGYVYVWEGGGQTRHTVTCGKCYGSGRVDCLKCLRTGRSGMCFGCTGTGEVNCGPCAGKGKVNCSTCGASGEVGCSKCSSTGYHTTTYTGQIHTSMDARYRVAGTGKNASQLARITTRLFGDKSFTPSLQGLMPNGKTVEATYGWSVPFSAGNLAVGGKSYEVNTWGEARNFLSTPLIIDDLLKPLGEEKKQGHVFFETLSSLPLGQQILTQAVGRGGSVPLSSYGGMLSRETIDALCEKARNQVDEFTGGLGQRYWWRAVSLAVISTALVAAFAISTSEHDLWRLIEPKLLSYALALIVLPLAIWMIGAFNFRFSSQRWVRELTGVPDANPLPRPWHASLAIIFPAVISAGVIYWLSVDPAPQSNSPIPRQLASQPGTPAAPVTPPKPTVTPIDAGRVVAPRPRPLSERPTQVRAAFAGLGGVWRGRYVCRQGVTDTTVDIRPDSTTGGVVANVKFSVPSGPNGEFIVKGTFDPGRKSFQMRPSSWVKQPYAYGMFGMELQPGATANTLEGRALSNGCSWIRLSR